MFPHIQCTPLAFAPNSIAKLDAKGKDLNEAHDDLKALREQHSSCLQTAEQHRALIARLRSRKTKLEAKLRSNHDEWKDKYQTVRGIDHR